MKNEKIYILMNRAYLTAVKFRLTACLGKKSPIGGDPPLFGENIKIYLKIPGDDGRGNKGGVIP